MDRDNVKKLFYILGGVFALALIVLFVVGMLVLHGNKDFAWPIVLTLFATLGCFLVPVFMNIAEEDRARKRAKNPRSNYSRSGKGNASSGTGSANFSNPFDYSAGFDSKKRSLSDSQIKVFDEYVARVFPELPFDSWKGSSEDWLHIKDEKVLKNVIFQMQKHLGIDMFILTAVVSNNELTKEPGLFRRTGPISGEIKVNLNLLNNSAVMAVLCHEVAHAYQSFKGHDQYSEDKNEYEPFTDILTYYLGFSDIVKTGYYTSVTGKDGNIHNIKLGYIEAGDFEYAKQIYSKRTSSIHSFEKEKKQLASLVEAYCAYVETMTSYSERLLGKYLPPDDKEFVKAMNEKYNSDEVKERIRQYKEKLERRSLEDIKMDIAGIEFKLEDLMEESKKIQRIHDFVFNQK